MDIIGSRSVGQRVGVTAIVIIIIVIVWRWVVVIVVVVVLWCGIVLIRIGGPGVISRILGRAVIRIVAVRIVTTRITVSIAIGISVTIRISEAEGQS